MQLQRGDVAVVTGAASGIGFALADRFASAGLHVVAADVQPEPLDEAVAKLAERGTDVIGVPTDVSSEEQVQALAAVTLERFGGVHMVCNNAGVASFGDPWIGPLSQWDWVIGVNLYGVVHGVRAFLPHLVLGGRGHIVNTASMAGLVPGLSPIYDATKHAVVALTEDLFHGLRDTGMPIGVSVLCPGWVRTNIKDSERNWPTDLGPLPEPALTSDVVRPHFDRAIDEGMTPAAVAELVANGIETDRFWLLPHPDWMPMAVDRWDRIGEGVDPEPLEHIPGMPPRSQIIAEAMAALASQGSPEE
jgi:NAD(P)-dependent dehydrogenase (short-subunit alcohol dehydrogenase family)